MTDLQQTDRTLDALVGVVLDTLPSKESRRAYETHLRRYLSWAKAAGVEPGRISVQQFVALMNEEEKRPATINVALSAIKKLYREAAELGWVDEGMAASVERIRGQKRLGNSAGNWLSREQMEAMAALPDLSTILGRRDHALIHLLYGCALRRQEACSLRLEQIQQRDGRWVLLDLVGKGRRMRTVPVPRFCEEAIMWWRDYRLLVDEAPEDAFYLRSVDGESLNDRSAHKIIVKYGRKLDVEVAPHDLRRTFAKHAMKGGAPLEQISVTLGHASLETTQGYLGIDLDLENPACDFITRAPR